MIRYDLPEAAPVVIQMFDISGRLIRVLENAPLKEAATYDVAWDGRNAQGARVSAGIYFYRLVAGSFRTTRKLVLLH